MAVDPGATPTPPPVPDPTPPPVPAGQKWYESAAFISWVLESVLSMAFGIAVLIGHPFDSTLITALIPSVAFGVAGVCTAVFVHGQNKLAQQRLAYQHEVAVLAYKARLARTGLTGGMAA